MPHTLDEERLIKLCLQGDEKAWAVFVGRFAALVHWAIKEKALRSPINIEEDDTADILQKVFIDIWRKNRLKDIRNPKAVSSWLTIVAQNATVDFVKRDRPPDKPGYKQLSDNIASSSRDPRAETIDRQLYSAVEAMVDELPLKERRIMTLELFYDLKHREIANIMGMPINTVSTIVARVKADLRDRLSKRGYNV